MSVFRPRVLSILRDADVGAARDADPALDANAYAVADEIELTLVLKDRGVELGLDGVCCDQGMLGGWPSRSPSPASTCGRCSDRACRSTRSARTCSPAASTSTAGGRHRTPDGSRTVPPHPPTRRDPDDQFLTEPEPPQVGNTTTRRRFPGSHSHRLTTSTPAGSLPRGLPAGAPGCPRTSPPTPMVGCSSTCAARASAPPSRRSCSRPRWSSRARSASGWSRGSGWRSRSRRSRARLVALRQVFRWVKRRFDLGPPPGRARGATAVRPGLRLRGRERRVGAVRQRAGRRRVDRRRGRPDAVDAARATGICVGCELYLVGQRLRARPGADRGDARRHGSHEVRDGGVA
jgi:hypothetical protein